ncbi:MAG: DUF1501 domain-containing protein [Flavobacteriaceae bacterium]|mgnify:FL=1|jgi:uncharacterized protein (DUF1501 family)|nr:DUF1501 domain-containing protein [Flavobacteriaceae bacterium]
MKRRQFIKLSSTASAIGLMPFQVNASLKLMNSFFNCDVSNRKLVLVELAGGNDGLNTVIPISAFTDYQTLRPNIHIPSSLYLPLNQIDTSLTGTNQDIALHPALTGFQNLYAADQLRIIQSVGYPSQNKSHFASKDIYATGNDGSNWNNGSDSGWIGRYMEQAYADLIPANYPLGIQIGSQNTNLGFHGIVEHGLALNINGQDSENFYSVLSGLGGTPPENIPNSHYGEELQNIINVDALSNQYSEIISNSFNAGSNSTTTTYPDTNLADQLKTVARLMRGGIQSKIFMVKLGGFDTHNNQNQASGDIQGDHYELMSQLSEAIEAFMSDLNSDSLADDVLGITFSEFGRKAQENGSLGTDHGEVAPVFAFGKPVKSGVSGVNVDLSEAVSSNNFQIQSVQYDYRQTFATIMQDFLGSNDAVVDAAFVGNMNSESFTDYKIPDLVKSEFLVPESCYDGSLSTPNQTLAEWSVYPNPFKTDFFVKSENQHLKTSYELRNYLGQRVLSGDLEFVNGNAKIQTNNLQNGLYILTLKNNIESHVQKLIKY